MSTNLWIVEAWVLSMLFGQIFFWSQHLFSVRMPERRKNSTIGNIICTLYVANKKIPASLNQSWLKSVYKPPNNLLNREFCIHGARASQNAKRTSRPVWKSKAMNTLLTMNVYFLDLFSSFLDCQLCRYTKKLTISKKHC